MPHQTGYEAMSKAELSSMLASIYGVQTPSPDAVQKLARVMAEILNRLPDEG